jgi:hypothetical protein
VDRVGSLLHSDRVESLLLNSNMVLVVLVHLDLVLSALLHSGKVPGGMATQHLLSIMHAGGTAMEMLLHPLRLAVDDDGAEGNETRQHSSSPVECVASRKGKGKAGTSKAKGSNFSQDEDHIVVKSWMEAVQQQKRKIRRKVS